MPSPVVIDNAQECRPTVCTITPPTANENIPKLIKEAAINIPNLIKKLPVVEVRQGKPIITCCWQEPYILQGGPKV